MFEIECPFCQEPCRVDAGGFVREGLTLRCEGCCVEVEFDKPTDAGIQSLAA